MEQLARRRNAVSRLTLVAGLGILSLVTAVAGSKPAAADSGIQVFVGYADILRADATTFPTPWEGSPQTTFEGCAPSSCSYDAGAVRVVNNTGSTVTVDAVKVHVDTCTYAGWPSATLAPGADLIVTELPNGTKVGCPGSVHMDTSDVGPGGKDYSLVCTPDGIQPTVEVTINGQTTSYTDSGQVLNTGGFDGACGGANESTQWTAIGQKPCKGSLLSLAPAAQTHGLGTTATVIATFTNSCGQALSNVAVDFAAISGPNAGRTGTGATGANGVATFAYSSQLVGTDALHASISNLVGTITSTPVTVTWVAFAPGDGAFVIGDLGNAMGAHAYWWGAQWWDGAARQQRASAEDGPRRDGGHRRESHHQAGSGHLRGHRPHHPGEDESWIRAEPGPSGNGYDRRPALLVPARLQSGAGSGDVIGPDHHAGIGGEVDESQVYRRVGQPLHDHCQLPRSVRHRQHQHLDLAIDRVAAGAQGRPRGVWIPGQDMDDALDFGEALDVHAGGAQGLDDPGEFAGAILGESNHQVPAHREPIVRLTNHGIRGGSA